MSDLLRVKNATSPKKEEAVVVKMQNTAGEGIPSSRKKGANLAFREMWADAFLRKKAGIEVSENLTVKQKAPAPYMYLRVMFIFLALLTVVLSIFYLLNGYEMYPLIITLLVAFVPMVTLIFFFEMDTSGRLSIYNMLLLFFVSCGVMLVIKFVSSRFIYEMGGEAISYYGAMAIGLMESFAMFILCSSFIGKLKIKDMVTGLLVGAVVGAGFGGISNLFVCFKESFVETQYTPMVEAVVLNEALFDSVISVLKVSVEELVMHSLSYTLLGAVLGGCFVNAFNKGFKDRVTVYVLLVITFMCWVFSSLWVVPFTSILFVYIIEIVMTATIVMAAVKTVRTGLSKNVYV